MKKVLIVDDHSIVRTGIKLVLTEISKSIQCYSASNKEEAFAVLKEQSDFDLIILDVNIPNYSCERMIEYCRVKCPHARLMILSMNSENMMAKRFYQLGIDAYVNKGSDDELIKHIILELFSNKKYFSPEFLLQIADETFGTSAPGENPFNSLSQREFEVMQYLLEGKNVQDISTILAVHPSTIGTYKSRIFEKLKVDNVIDLYNLYNFYK